MNSRALASAFRGFSQKSTALHATRQQFSTSTKLLTTAEASLPSQKPVGAFRSGIFGFLAGSAVAGSSLYYYILRDYKLSNEMLTEDIYALQAATHRLNSYVSELEKKLDQLQLKKGS